MNDEKIKPRQKKKIDDRKKPLRKTEINKSIQKFVDDVSDYLITGKGKQRFVIERKHAFNKGKLRRMSMDRAISRANE